MNMESHAWLGEYPSRWNMVKLRQVLTPVSMKNHPDMPLLSVVREKGVIKRNVEDKKENHNYVPDDLSNYKLVKCGQFAMNKMKAWQGSYGISKYDGIVSPAYFVFDVNYDLNPDFFNCAIRCMTYVSYFGRASDGIRVGQWDLSIGRMKEIPFLVPPREEQDQIVRFLDWKVSGINRLINIKRKEIKDLESMKQATVSSAVTRGLNPNAPMKFSGVKWLGNIPVHWELLRNKNIFQETKEIVGDKADLYPLLSLTTKGIILRDTASGKGKFPKDFNTYKIVRQGDIAFCLFDIDETPRTVGLSDYDGMLTGAYTIFHVKNVNSRYVYYYYLALDNVKALRSLYSGLRKTINTGTFLGTKLPVPPREEQDQIVRFLDSRMSDFNRLISLRKQQIEELEDLKTRLISDVVTGKIDIRDVKIPSFDMVEEDIDEEISEDIVEANQKTEAE